MSALIRYSPNHPGYDPVFHPVGSTGDLSAEVSNSSVQPIVQLTDGNLFTIDRVVRKLAHVAEYLVLGLCLMVNVLDLRKSREGQRPQGGRRSMIADCGIAWAVGTIYAVTDEFHQTMVPGRSGEVLDVCIDAAGVLCGVVIMSVINRESGGEVK